MMNILVEIEVIIDPWLVITEVSLLKKTLKKPNIVWAVSLKRSKPENLTHFAYSHLTLLAISDTYQCTLRISSTINKKLEQ